RGELADLLGEPARRPAPEPEVRWSETRDGIRWDGVSYRSEPEVRVPALFLAAETPRGAGLPPAAGAVGEDVTPEIRPAIVLLHPEGNSAWLAEEGAGELLSDLLAAGYAAFLPDVRLRGELQRDWRHNTIVWGR